MTLIKSVVFATIIVQIGYMEGLRVSGGPEAVGRATTTAVVEINVPDYRCRPRIDLVFLLDGMEHRWMINSKTSADAVISIHDVSVSSRGQAVLESINLMSTAAKFWSFSVGAVPERRLS